jgi:hypothetical protein
MPNPYTQQQLENTWNYYVTLAPADVVYYTSPGSAGYDVSFSAMLSFIFLNRLFGFEQYT